MVEAVSVAFTDSGHTWITAEFAVGNDDRYLTLKVYGWRNVASVPTSTLIASAQHATDSGFGGAWRASAVLEFSL
jgi:hypothetical protein